MHTKHYFLPKISFSKLCLKVNWIYLRKIKKSNSEIYTNLLKYMYMNTDYKPYSRGVEDGVAGRLDVLGAVGRGQLDSATTAHVIGRLGGGGGGGGGGGSRCGRYKFI